MECFDFICNSCANEQTRLSLASQRAICGALELGTTTERIHWLWLIHVTAELEICLKEFV